VGKGMSFCSKLCLGGGVGRGRGTEFFIVDYAGGWAGGCVSIQPHSGGGGQGNEFSYYMLLASNLVLNGSDGPNQWRIFPWLLSSCNQLSDADQLRPVRPLVRFRVRV
jgi:N2227-like protein